VTDVIVIGGGLNGLVTAAMLAKARLSVTLIEQQPVVGGACITSEIAPGFRAPVLSHSLGPVSRDVVQALRLNKVSGLEFVTPDPSLTSIAHDGRPLAFHRDVVLTAASINEHSSADAGKWTDFLRTSQRIANVVAALDRLAPPPIDDAGIGDAWRLLSAGRAARALSRRDLTRLTRWVPMSIADVTSEWFESPRLRAAIAAHAIAGHAVGPRSAGTGGFWLQRMAADPVPVGSGVTLRGGPGTLSDALAGVAGAARATIRTGASVARVLVANGRATGVTLTNGEEITARAVVAAISPKAAMLNLVDAGELPPTYRQRMQSVRARGVTAKINLALSALPHFTALGPDTVPLGGRLLIGPDLDYLERAFDATKYGEISEQPWLELSIPSVRDESLAPSGAHVMSIYAHFVPRTLRDAAPGTQHSAHELLWKNLMAVLESYAPGIGQLIVARQILTPADLEAHWGLPGGHIFHAEATLDQLWAARPLLGWARYRTPVAGLYLASAGTHPGGGLTGLSGWLASEAVVSDLKKRR